MQRGELGPWDALAANDTPASGLLAEAGLRPTRQRLALAEHLFSKRCDQDPRHSSCARRLRPRQLDVVLRLRPSRQPTP